MPLRIEPISRSHNRRSFDCGIPDLNQYLQNTARQQSEKGISRTFVLVEDSNPSEMVGFSLWRHAKSSWRSCHPGLPRNTLCVPRLLKSPGWQWRCPGRSKVWAHYMMLRAMERVLRVAEHLGVIVFFVDAKNEGAAAHYRQFGFIPLPDSSLELFLPIATIRKAFLERGSILGIGLDRHRGRVGPVG